MVFVTADSADKVMKINVIYALKYKNKYNAKITVLLLKWAIVSLEHNAILDWLAVTEVN